MLCFLPPLASIPGFPIAQPSRHATTAAALLLAAVAVMELVTPVGWSHTQPEYAVRVGETTRLGPRPFEQTLMPSQRTAVPDDTSKRRRFAASRTGYNAVPPGLEVDAATGVLVGVPLLAGSYTVAVEVSDGATRSRVGPSFRVKVLPAL